MTKTILSFKLPHLVVRSLAAANLIYLAVDLTFPASYHWVARIDTGDIIGGWLFLSSLLLPGFVIFEVGWAMKKRAYLASRSIVLDGAFAFAWFFIWWGTLLYLFRHNVIWL